MKTYIKNFNSFILNEQTVIPDAALKKGGDRIMFIKSKEGLKGEIVIKHDGRSILSVKIKGEDKWYHIGEYKDKNAAYDKFDEIVHDKDAAKDDWAHIRDLEDAEEHDDSNSWKDNDEEHIEDLEDDAHDDHEEE
jgi:hypothetical protein